LLILKKHTQKSTRSGPYEFLPGVGYHELLITRDHEKAFGDLEKETAEKVLTLLQERYRMLARDRCIEYVATFFNWGPSAGASVYHPHYQVLALPILPPGIKRSLEGSARYFKQHHRCVHCEIIAFEKKAKKRIIDENKYAIVVAPFASHEPFELRVFPKTHEPYFERPRRIEAARSGSITSTYTPVPSSRPASAVIFGITSMCQW